MVRQPDRVERRFAAILAPDVAGYSQLMGIDEASTARNLREHRAVTDAQVAKVWRPYRQDRGRWLADRVCLGSRRGSVQIVMIKRNARVPEDRRILFRVGINLDDFTAPSDSQRLHGRQVVFPVAVANHYAGEPLSGANRLSEV